MKNLHIRPLESKDLDRIIEIDHNYPTEYVWQMDIQSGERDLTVGFREVRLPRTMQVNFPLEIEEAMGSWDKSSGVLVAEVDGGLVGYISLKKGDSPTMVRISGMAVVRRLRRQGAGTSLILAAQSWAVQNNANRLQMEVQSKNFPAISLANKLGFEFCGYNDRYFDNQDIVLFFSKRL